MRRIKRFLCWLVGHDISSRGEGQKSVKDRPGLYDYWAVYQCDCCGEIFEEHVIL